MRLDDDNNTQITYALYIRYLLYRLLENISNKHSLTTDLKLSLLKPARKQRVENRAYSGKLFYFGFQIYIWGFLPPRAVYVKYTMCCAVMFFRLNHNVYVHCVRTMMCIALHIA